MACTSEIIKRLTFVGVVFLTLAMFMVAVVYDIVASDSYIPEDATDVLMGTSHDDMGDANGSLDESDSTVESGELEDGFDSNQSEADDFFVEYMAGATHSSLDVYVSSPYCFVYEATENVILYEKNAYEKCFPASVTKLLTAAVAMEYVPLDTPFKVGAEINMVGENSSMAYIKEGSSFTLKDLLYALLLPSGNDAAYTIAVNTSRYLYGDSLGDEEAVDKFMELCSEKLLEIGAYNTHFTVPDGYHADNHYTTAYDMMLISLYSTSFEEIEIACGTYEYYCKSLEGEATGWLNCNPLMKKRGDYYCEYVTGLKTGSTTEAGKCLATLAEKDGKKLYIIMLGSSNVDMRNNDTLSIIYSVLGY